MPTPRKDLDPAGVEKLAAIGCTDAEIAEFYSCSQGHVRGRYRESLDAGRAKLKQSIRRAQLKAMRQGNITMMIWLGKQCLGQTDKQEISEHGGTLRIVERIEPAGPGTEPGSDHGSPDAPAT